MNQDRPMDARFPWIADRDQLTICSQANHLEATRTLLTVVQNKLAIADTDFNTNPRRSEMLRDDVAYKLGVVDALKSVLALPADAEAIVQRAEKQQGSKP